MVGQGVGPSARDPLIARQVLAHMGITPWVLRDREPQHLQASQSAEPPVIEPAVVQAPAQTPLPVPAKAAPAVVIPTVEVAATKVAAADLKDQPVPKVAAEAQGDAAGNTLPALHFACVLRGELLIMAQLPNWSNGLLEHVSAGFLKDLLIHLPEGETPRDVMAIDLPNQTELDVRGMVQGRLLRERSRGVRRCLLLSDHAALIAPAVPADMALFEASSLQTLWESGDAKRALWQVIQRVSSSV